MLTTPRIQQTPDSRPLTDVQRYLSLLVSELTAELGALAAADEGIATKLAELAAADAALSASIATINAIPILQGRLTGLISLAAGVSQNIAHGLGRTYVGWILTRVSYTGASAVPIQEGSGNPDPALYVRLNCQQPVSLFLWVF